MLSSYPGSEEFDIGFGSSGGAGEAFDISTAPKTGTVRLKYTNGNTNT
jgi:hypothetical protein